MMDNKDIVSRFVNRILLVSKSTISAPTPSSETFDIALRNNYAIMKYSLENHSAGYMAIIITGIVIVISVVSAIIKKLFGGSSSKDSDAQSNAKIITTHSRIFGTVSDNTARAAEHAEFDFNLDGLDYSKMTKPSEMPDDVYQNTQKIADEFKQYGDRDVLKSISSLMLDENGEYSDKVMRLFDRVKGITSINRTLFAGLIGSSSSSLSGLLDEIKLIKNENEQIYKNSVLNDVVSILEKKDITEKDLIDINDKLDKATKDMSSAPVFLENMMKINKQRYNDYGEFSVDAFFQNAIKLIKDKKTIDVLNDYYASCSGLQQTLVKFSDDLKAQQAKVSTFMNMSFESMENINDFKDKYKKYITEATNMQKTSYLLIDNAVTLLKEYESIFVAFFNIAMVVQTTVFYALLRFKEVGINVSIQVQNLAKSNKEFLNYAKAISNSVNGEIKKDTDSHFVIFKTRDRSQWSSVTNDLEDLHDSLFKYTDKMVQK